MGANLQNTVKKIENGQRETENRKRKIEIPNSNVLTCKRVNVLTCKRANVLTCIVRVAGLHDLGTHFKNLKKKTPVKQKQGV